MVLMCANVQHVHRHAAKWSIWLEFFFRQLQQKAFLLNCYQSYNKYMESKQKTMGWHCVVSRTDQMRVENEPERNLAE